jgi:hypothetical protein
MTASASLILRVVAIILFLVSAILFFAESSSSAAFGLLALGLLFLAAAPLVSGATTPDRR